jgi:osmotically-inducible protein OsmY
LRRDIVNALGWDSWVDGNTINVEVVEGVVTLTGTVKTSTEKRAAGDDAWDIPGVLDVQNQLQIVR